MLRIDSTAVPVADLRHTSSMDGTKCPRRAVLSSFSLSMFPR